MDKLYDAYLVHSKINKKVYYSDTLRVKYLKMLFKDIRYGEEFKPRHVDRLKDALLKKGDKKSTINV